MPFRWLFEEGQPADACIDQLSYEDFLEFVFDHPIPKKWQDRWYCLESAERFYYKDNLLFLKRLAALMNEPEQLLDKYSTDQIKQGFWCFITGFELSDLLEDKYVDFSIRRQCIESLEPLYRRLFNRPGYEKIAFLYWDPLTYSFADNQSLLDDFDQLNVQDAMLSSLIKISRHSERINFISAARGLSHLRHRLSAEAIHEALRLRMDLSEEDRAYALACARGEVDSTPRPPLPGKE